MLGPLLLFVCALLWGTSFVAQKASAACLGPFAVICSRAALAAVFLFVWAKVARGRGFTRAAWTGGAAVGFTLFIAMLAQQVGIAATQAGISAFLTSNYILIVPVLGMFVGRPTHWIVWLGVVVALAGSYLICIDPSAGFAVGRGELWTLLCSFLFAVEILCVDRFAPKADVLALSCVAQITLVVCAAPFLFLPSETALFTPARLKAAVGPIAYISIVSSGIAFTLQNIGQRRTPPTLATVIMSLEAVFASLTAYLWSGDVMTARQVVGCALLFLTATVTPLLAMRRR